jgi:ribosomal-protein-alanine N-acetyltransferase
VDSYRIELARRADAPLLAAMSAAHVEAGLRPAWGAARIGWHVRDADSVVLTARAAERVAGFAIMRYADESAHLNLLAVDPAHRRRGIARRLLTWLEESALTAGTFIVGLELRATNATSAPSTPRSAAEAARCPATTRAWSPPCVSRATCASARDTWHAPALP